MNGAMEGGNDRNGSIRRLRRLLLSAFIVFHLVAVTVAPNTNSLLGQKINPWIEPYLSFFELTNSWSFFAPDPGPPPVFVEWELLDSGGKALASGSLPESLASTGIRERQNRKIAAVEFMIASDDRLQKMLVPYLCKTDSRIHSVNVWKKAVLIPSSEEVAKGKRTLDDGLSAERRWVGRVFCEGTGA